MTFTVETNSLNNLRINHYRILEQILAHEHQRWRVFNIASVCSNRSHPIAT